MEDKIEATSDMVITLVCGKDGDAKYQFSVNELTTPFAFSLVIQKLEDLLLIDEQKARLKKNKSLPKNTVLLSKEITKGCCCGTANTNPYVLIEWHKDLYRKVPACKH
jgi:hypothetical protein